eukprot:5073757-Lingulodinium_polyedra.AAC.1
MGSSQMGRRCRGSASSPPGLGRSSPSGSASGHAPTRSTASRMRQSNWSNSSGRSDNSPGWRPSSPGFFRLPTLRKMDRSLAT